MELRGCSHLHFIQTVQGGKMLNVFRGKPALKFKELKDIYETREGGNHHLLPAVRPKLEFKDLPIDRDRAMAESPCMLAGATIKSESKSLESNLSSAGDGGKTEDDVDFGMMTLKQIKERCKAKKRKPSQNASFIGQTTETFSPAKQEHSDSQFELEEFEAMEPLSSWKSRILKSRKKKRKCRLESSFASSSESALCIVKSSDHVVFQSSAILSAPIDIKVEVSEPIFVDYRYATLTSVDSLGECSEPLASNLGLPSGGPEVADGCVLETETSTVSIEEPETANDGGNEPLASNLGVPSGEPEVADGCVLETEMSVVSIEEPETANDGGPQMSAFFSEEPQCCVVSEQSHEYVDHVNPELILDINASRGEILAVDIAGAISPLSSDLSSSEIKEEHSSGWGSEPLASSVVVSSGELEIADGCLLETGMSIVSVEEPEKANDDSSQKSASSNDEPSILDVNASCGEILTVGIAEAISLPSSNLSLSEIKEEYFVVDSHPSVDRAGVVLPIKDDSSIACHDSQSEEPDRVTDHGPHTHKSSFFSNELQCCVVNQESYEHVKHADPKSMPDVRASAGEIMMVDVAELTADHKLGLSSTELKKESCAADPHPQHCGDDSIVVASPSKHHTSDMGNDSQIFPGVHELLEPNSDSKVQVLDISMVNTSQSTELRNRHGLHLFEDGAKDDRPHVEAGFISSPVSGLSSFRDSNLCSGQNGCVASAAAEEKKSPLSACANAARKFSAVPCTDEPVTLADAQGRHHSNLPHLPERLLSTRKTISPTSQKSLCKAMESSDLDDEEYYRYTRKLCYRNLIENKTGRLGRANQNQRVDFTIIPERIIRKPKNAKSGFHHKGILKVPHPSRTVLRFGTSSTSIQNCSESAISFSQQQMRDIESIATKLTKELNSMKDIVQETWHSKFSSATPLKYNADEVKTAVQSATRVEESAKRCLSVMARDCNRFCTIMKLTDKASATSGNVVLKEKRKIVFADEAGGKLCDVKTFENDTASVTESGSDKSVNFD